MNQVAEGVKTAKVARELAREDRRRGADHRRDVRDHARRRAGARGDQRAAHPPDAHGARLSATVMAGMLGYILDEVFVHHRAPSGHPERPARAEAVRDALDRRRHRERAARHVATRMATDEELVRVHAAAYLDELASGRAGQDRLARRRHLLLAGHLGRRARGRRLDGAARARRPARPSSSQGIAVVRPPGHHATRDRAMGFCLLNNVAAAAAAARAARRRARRDPRLGRPPRQRHAGHLLGRSERAVPVGPPVPVLPGHRRGDRDRRRRARSAPRSTSGCRAAAATPSTPAVFDHVFLPKLARVQARRAADQRRVRRVPARSARRHAGHPRRVRGDGAPAARRGRALVAADASSRCSRAATISTGSAAG